MAMARLLRMWPRRLDQALPVPKYTPVPLQPHRLWHPPDESLYELAATADPLFVAPARLSLAGVVEDIADGI